MTPSSSIKNAGTLLSGNIIAQGIAFVSYLLLSRLFTPDDFGVYNIFYSYIEVLIILSTCKFEQAIVVAEGDAQAAGVARLALRINTGVSLLLLVAAACLQMPACGGSLPIPAPMVLLIPAMVFLCGTSRVYTFLGVRDRRYPTLAYGQVWNAAGTTVLRVAAGFVAPVVRWLQTFGLPLGTVLGRLAANLYLRKNTTRLLHDPTLKGGDRRALRHLGKRYRQYPLYVMPKEFVGSLSANLPFLWLSIHFDNAAIGLFAMSLTFLQRPVLMIANALEQSYFRDISERHQQRQALMPHLRPMLWGVGGVAVAVAAIGFFVAEPLFVFLLGDQWVGTGFYVQCLLPWLVVRLLVNSLTFVGNVFETQHIDFLLQVLLLLLRVAALYVGIRFDSFRMAVLLFCGVSAVVQTGQLIWYLWQIRRYDKSRADG